MEISTSEFSWNTPSESNGITRKLKVRQASGHSVEAEAVWVGWVEAGGLECGMAVKWWLLTQTSHFSLKQCGLLGAPLMLWIPPGLKSSTYEIITLIPGSHYCTSRSLRQVWNVLIGSHGAYSGATADTGAFHPLTSHVVYWYTVTRHLPQLQSKLCIPLSRQAEKACVNWIGVV